MCARSAERVGVKNPEYEAGIGRNIRPMNLSPTQDTPLALSAVLDNLYHLSV